MVRASLYSVALALPLAYFSLIRRKEASEASVAVLLLLYLLSAATEDLNKAKEDISISVTSAYLQILFNEELAKVAHNQVELSREQLELKEAYFKNGKASEAEVYEARARVAQDEMSAVQADNNYQLALLELSQLLELPTPDGFGVVSPRVEDDFTLLSAATAL